MHTFQNTLAAESVFVHLKSKTLIVTDMAFNIRSSDFKSSFERLILGKWNGILDTFGPSKLAKNLAARNRKEVATALRKIATFDFERVVVNHGEIVENDGKRRFLEGFNKTYGNLI